MSSSIKLFLTQYLASLYFPIIFTVIKIQTLYFNVASIGKMDILCGSLYIMGTHFPLFISSMQKKEFFSFRVNKTLLM
jgi:hypothetical protein